MQGRHAAVVAALPHCALPAIHRGLGWPALVPSRSPRSVPQLVSSPQAKLGIPDEEFQDSWKPVLIT